MCIIQLRKIETIKEGWRWNICKSYLCRGENDSRTLAHRQRGTHYNAFFDCVHTGNFSVYLCLASNPLITQIPCFQHLKILVAIIHWKCTCISWIEMNQAKLSIERIWRKLFYLKFVFFWLGMINNERYNYHFNKLINSICQAYFSPVERLYYFFCSAQHPKQSTFFHNWGSETFPYVIIFYIKIHLIHH